jgi:hypothetical protein
MINKYSCYENNLPWNNFSYLGTYPSNHIRPLDFLFIFILYYIIVWYVKNDIPVQH